MDFLFKTNKEGLVSILNEEEFSGKVFYTNFDTGDEKEEKYERCKLLNYLIGDYIIINQINLLTSIDICACELDKLKQQGKMVTLFLVKKRNALKRVGSTSDVSNLITNLR